MAVLRPIVGVAADLLLVGVSKVHIEHMASGDCHDRFHQRRNLPTGRAYRKPDGLWRDAACRTWRVRPAPRPRGSDGGPAWGDGSGRQPYRHQRFLWPRSEEHTSELPSLMRISYAVFCLKKKKTQVKN